MYGTARGHRLRLLAVGVPGLRHAPARTTPTPTTDAGRPATGRRSGATTSPAPANTSPVGGELAAAHRHAVPGRRGRTGAPARSRPPAPRPPTSTSTAPASCNIRAIRDGAGNWTSGRIETQRTDFAPQPGELLRFTAVLRQPDVANGLGYWPGFRATGAAYRGNFTNWPGVGETDIMTDVNGRSQLAQTLHCGTAPDGVVRRVQRAHQRPRHLRRLPDRLPRVHARSSTAPRPTRRSASTSTAGRPGSSGRARSASPPGRPPCTTASTCGSTWPSAARCRTRSPGVTTPTAETTSGGVLSVDSVTVSRATGTTAAGDDRPGHPGRARAPCGSPARRATGSSRSTARRTRSRASPTARRRRAADGYMRDLRNMGVNTIRTWGVDDAQTPTLLEPGRPAGHQGDRRALAQPGRRLRQRHRVQERREERDRGPGQRAQEPPGRADVGRRQRGHPHHAGPRAAGRRGRGAAGRVRAGSSTRSRWPSTRPTRTTRSPRPTRGPARGPYYKAHSPGAGPARGQLLRRDRHGQAGLDRRRLHQAVHRHRGRPGRRVGGAERRQRRARPSRPTCRSGRCTRRAGTPSRATRAWRSARPSSTTDWRTTSAASGSTRCTGGWRRLGLPRAASRRTPAQPSANTPPEITSMTVGIADRGAGRRHVHRSTSAATDPQGDLIRYNLMFSDKHITGNRGFDQRASSPRPATASSRCGRRSSSASGRSTCTPSTATATWASSSARSGWCRRPSPGTNMALGRPVTASSYQPTGTNGPQLPSYAVDGNYGTRWASEWVDTAWLQVDLGSVQSFNHVLLAWEAAYARSYQIQTSTTAPTGPRSTRPPPATAGSTA